jgi:imidazole glycerol-phosphate synthase subunit HisF
MVLKRIMPCLLVKEKRLVKTINFQNPSYVGDPINAVKIFNDKEVDELVLLDINASKTDSPIDFELISAFAAECFMPLAYGGGVKSLEDFKKIYRLGIEKVIINTLIFDNPSLIKKAINNYGSQSVVASIDVKRNDKNEYQIYSHAKRVVEKSLIDFINYTTSLGVGEILLTSVDREGTWEGYDTDLLNTINNMIDMPLIANGGCGRIDDLKKVLYENNVQAAAIGSMAVYQKKDMGVLIRFPKRTQIINE